MKNLLNFFFSFDKLFKEKLIVPFFWLAIIYFGVKFLIEAVDTVQLDPLLWIIVPVFGLVKILFTLVSIRIVAELIVAGFRINDNLSPDGGKSELADIDPVAEARKAAELAAARTREATKTMRENVGEMSENVQGKAKAATASVREKADDLKAKTGLERSADPALETKLDAAPKKRGRPASTKAKTTAAKKPAKKRGRPAGSKNKTTASKPTTSKSTPSKTAARKPAGKRGPKPGSKIPRDADGNLLKKDGTPRKKPGPRKS
jgi:hypothetical protein